MWWVFGVVADIERAVVGTSGVCPRFGWHLSCVRVVHGEDVVMPKQFPPGFRGDVVEGATSVGQAELVALRRRARVLGQEVEILRRATAYFAKDAAPK